MSQIEFSVLMLGARRTGKSSVLASMLDNFQRVTSGCDVTLSAIGETVCRLQAKKDELMNVFNTKMYGDTWVVDALLDPNSAKIKYLFNMNVHGSDNEYKLVFTDIPGEDIASAKISDIAQDMIRSHVIIITVDTPHLMEEEGRFNEAFNKISTLNQLFTADNRLFSINKLILFVPLKCEKYYHEGRMKEVREAVKKEYDVIIKHLGNKNISSKVTMAITPILTMGDVVFSHFQKNDKGLVNVCLDGVEKYRPKYVHYTFRNKNPKFSPHFCEQPLIYTLSFLRKCVQ